MLYPKVPLSPMPGNFLSQFGTSGKACQNNEKIHKPKNGVSTSELSAVASHCYHS
jgi:hypothetical protein